MKPSEIGNIELAKKALQGTMISCAKIEEIINCLRMIFEMIGLRAQHLPSEDAKGFLLSFIQKNYAHKTLTEVLLAFELAITGKLDLSVDETKCYDQFTCAYFATVMESYRRWLKLQADNKKTFKEPVQQLEAKKSLTDEEWNEWLQDIKNYDTSIVPVSAYDRLEANGLAITTPKKIEFFEMAKKWYLARCKEGTDEHRDFIKWMKNQKKDATHQIISDYAKKLIVKAYLNEQL